MTLKDAVGNTLVKYNATTIAAEETIAETLYRKDAAGNAVAEATGLEISLDENEKTLLMMQLLQLLLGRELRKVQYILMM